jgi:ketosteroid isomerase-like protein
MHLILFLALVLLPASLTAQTRDADERELRRLHADLIRAHVEKDPDLWMSIESDDYVSANSGRVTFPAPVDRRAGREAYLRSATFSRYRDIREPIVRVSADGSLGWLIAEVEIAGRIEGDGGATRAFDDVWAWVELYERGADGWKLVGNVSNSRPPDPEEPRDPEEGE